MVVSNQERNLLNAVPMVCTSKSWNDNPVEENISHEEWQAAVETLLPRLLRPHHQSRENHQHFSEPEYEESNGIRGLGRWLRSFGQFNGKRLSFRNHSAISLTHSQMKDFLVLLEKPSIQKFFEEDGCKILADAYLIAIVFTYFVRAGFTYQEYNETNFFAALTLAHEIEEENYLIELFLMNWEVESFEANPSDFVPMHHLRYELFVRMNFRALVSRKCCEEVMSLCPEHWAWKRCRNEKHAGVFQDRRYPSNPSSSPLGFLTWETIKYNNRLCEECLRFETKKAEKGKRNTKKIEKLRSHKKRQNTEECDDVEKKFCP